MRNRRLVPAEPAADPPAAPVAALFREHHGELVRLALLMVGDLPTAEDVLQDVYASLHKRWSHVAAPDEILPYVRAAVLNGCRSVLRRRGIARRAGVLHSVSARTETIAAHGRGPAHRRGRGAGRLRQPA